MLAQLMNARSYNKENSLCSRRRNRCRRLIIISSLLTALGYNLKKIAELGSSLESQAMKTCCAATLQKSPFD
jgi:hypothetical protein